MLARFRDDVVQNLPHLYNFARRLAGNRSFADDLVQETILRAFTHADQFRPGTNLRAWLMTILRNAYFNEKRRTRRLADFDPELSATLSAPHGEQDGRLLVREVACRFAVLPAVQREALILVGANGYSYDDAAKIAGCAIGTMKSRVSRARLQLQNLMENSRVEDGRVMFPINDLDQRKRAA